MRFLIYCLGANCFARRFRWAALQLEELQDCSDEADIHETLRNIPQSLEQSYERTLARIPLKNQGRVRAILLWLIYSFRPLKLREVAAIAGLTFPDDVLRVCTSSLVSTSEELIWIDDSLQTCVIVRLAHFSVQEYLCSGKTRNLDTDRSFHMYAKLGHFKIGMQCVKELFKLNQVLHNSPSIQEPDDGGEPDDQPDDHAVRSLLDQYDPASTASLSQYTGDGSDHGDSHPLSDFHCVGRVVDHNPLFVYSVLNWHKHAELIQPADTETRALVNLINEFFSMKASLSYISYRRFYGRWNGTACEDVRKRIPPIYVASSYGLIDNEQRIRRF